GRLEQAGAARDAVLEKLLTMVEIPLPDAAVADELQSRRDSIEQQLAYAGMTEADYLESEGQTEDEFAADLDKRVRDAMAAQFILDEIATAEALGVDEGELTQHLLRRAQQSGQSPEEYIKHIMEHNHVPEMVSEVRRGKALAHIVEAATVKDASGNVVELKTLQPDGTYADPEELAAQAEAEAQAQAAAAAPSTDAAADVVATTDYLVAADDEAK
ncbi:MAG: trigger factor, partial [Nocardioidaceae bacterium]